MHSLFLGKELELVQEVERYLLDIVMLTLTHSTLSTKTSLLRGVGLSSMLEFLSVRGGGQG